MCVAGSKAVTSVGACDSSVPPLPARHRWFVPGSGIKRCKRRPPVHRGTGRNPSRPILKRSALRASPQCSRRCSRRGPTVIRRPSPFYGGIHVTDCTLSARLTRPGGPATAAAPRYASSADLITHASPTTMASRTTRALARSEVAESTGLAKQGVGAPHKCSAAGHSGRRRPNIRLFGRKRRCDSGPHVGDLRCFPAKLRKLRRRK